jgi:hypothetical protein
MTTRVLAPGILAMLLSAGLSAQQEKLAESPEKRLALSKKNAAAEELESLVLALGLDANRGDPSAEHPSKEDLDAYQRAGFGSWLDAQLKTADDSISPVPANIRTFLEKRQPTLWRVAALLGRDTPEWESDRRADPYDSSGALLSASLARILLAAALSEERAGHQSQAGDFLEATWSLYRSFSGQPHLMSQLIAVAIGKIQAGALRKMSEPPVQWLDRMSGVEPWRGMLDAVAGEARLARPGGDAAEDESRKVWSRARSAAMDRLRELSPCEVSKLSYEEIWKPAKEEITRSVEEGGGPGLEPLLDIAMPNITGAIRRAGRLVVDRELTARILEIKLEKTASREGRWPEKFSDLDSRVCPGFSYDYQTRGAAMMVRFKGPIDDGGGSGLVLPLSFEVRAPRPTPTPTHVRRPAVTPRPRA